MQNTCIALYVARDFVYRDVQPVLVSGGENSKFGGNIKDPIIYLFLNRSYVVNRTLLFTALMNRIIVHLSDVKFIQLENQSIIGNLKL